MTCPLQIFVYSLVEIDILVPRASIIKVLYASLRANLNGFGVNEIERMKTEANATLLHCNVETKAK